jgi:hypothetical protein
MDRLSPFTRLIQTLVRSRTRGAEPAPASRDEGTQERAPAETLRTPEELRERLRARMAPLVNATPERRCAAFVETVLQWELSDGAANDPKLADIVQRVSRELSNDADLSARLDRLLTELPGP